MSPDPAIHFQERIFLQSRFNTSVKIFSKLFLFFLRVFLINFVLLNPRSRGRSEAGSGLGRAARQARSPPQCPTSFLRVLLSLSSWGGSFLFIFIILLFKRRFPGIGFLPSPGKRQSEDSAAVQLVGTSPTPRAGFGKRSRGGGFRARHPPLRAGGSGETSL